MCLAHEKHLQHHLCSLSLQYQESPEALTQKKNQRKVVDYISECHGRFHLATYFMLKWVLSSFCSAGNGISVPEKTSCAPWSQKYCRKRSCVIGNLTIYHRDWTILGCGCQWLQFSYREGAGLHAVCSCPSSSFLMSSPEMPMQQSCQRQRQLTCPGNNPLMQWLLGLFGNRLWHGIH